MNTPPRGGADRTRATQRLRNLTIGTTLAGLAASGGFTWLASATFDGTGTTAAAVSSLTTTADSSTGSSTTPSPTLVPSTSSVSGSSGKAHASTGGS